MKLHHTLSLLLLSIAAAPAWADCSNWSRFSASEAYLAPLSVPAADIGAHLSASEWSDGVEFRSDLRGGDLWLDIIRFPGQVSAAKAPSTIMMVGRLADDGFERLVLAHDDAGLFTIDRDALRDIGCRFIWGRTGGENPIALLRDLYRNLSYYETGQPLSTRFNGHLLGDTNLAMTLNNEVLIPAWVMEDLQ